MYVCAQQGRGPGAPGAGVGELWATSCAGNHTQALCESKMHY